MKRREKKETKWVHKKKKREEKTKNNNKAKQNMIKKKKKTREKIKKNKKRRRTPFQNLSIDVIQRQYSEIEFYSDKIASLKSTLRRSI